jgi:hypothetical protein
MNVTGAAGVRWAHLVHIADDERVWIHVVLLYAVGRKRLRLLGKDTRKVLQCKEKTS